MSGVSVCVRYLLFFFNLIFALTGLAIIVVAALAQVKLNEHEYSRFIADNFQYVPIVLMAVGTIIAIIAFLGCCGSVKENHCMLISFGALLIAVFFLEFGAGLSGYIFRDEIANGVEMRMNKAVQTYYDDVDTRKIVDGMQLDLSCCGAKGIEDYAGRPIPYSCCSAISPEDTCAQEVAWTRGCLPTLEHLVSEYGFIPLFIILGVGVIQLIGIVFAFCLARSIRRGYESV